MTDRIAVLGAGMVGTSAALELRRKGHEVVLIDRRGPGEETSYGNAGVIARESVKPINSPELWKILPKMVLNRSAKMRYAPGYILKNAGWMTRFLWNARGSKAADTARALDALLGLSKETHLAWVQEAGIPQRVRQDGWMDLHRTQESLDGGMGETKLFDELGLRWEVLDAKALHDLEPHIKPGFAGAIWAKDAATVDNPGAVVKAYAKLFAQMGGEIREQAVTGLEQAGAGWTVRLGAESLEAKHVVVAMGAWSKPLLKSIGVRPHLANERGYHMHYAAEGNATLGRPFYDVSGAYVIAPMEQGLRLTTGVEFNETDAPKNLAQWRMAEQNARKAFPLAEKLEDEPWMGRRPTTPDGRPIIGAAPRRPGLWLDYGHQHVGFTSGPGSARLLAALIGGETPPIDPAPFRPDRF